MQEDSALIRGKVWKRDDEDEPADWSIEVTDALIRFSVTEGSRRDLIAYSPSFVYFDNFQVSEERMMTATKPEHFDPGGRRSSRL